MFMASFFFFSFSVKLPCMGECLDSEWNRVSVRIYLTIRVVDEQCVISSSSSKGWGLRTLLGWKLGGHCCICLISKTFWLTWVGPAFLATGARLSFWDSSSGLLLLYSPHKQPSSSATQAWLCLQREQERGETAPAYCRRVRKHEEHWMLVDGAVCQVTVHGRRCLGK